MEKRFQVFVSSTFQDLEVERQEVMHALLELDCMPAGMELFPAANESQWNLIKKVIDDCDYYILILAGRYGSIGPEGLSYTEMEYRYALSINKPTIAFIHRHPGKIIAEKTETTNEGKEKLATFRSTVEKKLCKHWDSPQELGSVVSRSLIQLVRSTPAVGWVRANELADRDATMELLQLRRRVDELQAELAKARTSAPKGSEELAQGDEAHKLRFSFLVRGPGEINFSARNSFFLPTWNQMFSVVAPLMINEASEQAIKSALDAMMEEHNLPKLREYKELARYDIRHFSLHKEDFQTVKIQFRALGLIAKSEKARSLKDSGTYWTLTPYGDEVMTRLRAIRSYNFDEELPAESIQEGEG
ncbi:DUF4062 domain-containing protein [Nitrospira sp. NS4]|uniref:DUF4062 domain-containing protein n=1 Tax=Nitrospira sp. NS4 TaxID=3414498 RepID=UPI003C2E5ADC